MDGQLARLRKTESLCGTIIDGICDHICDGVVYLLFAVVLFDQTGYFGLLFVFLAGLSRFVQTSTYELQRHVYEFWVSEAKKNKIPGINEPAIRRDFFFLKRLYDFFQSRCSCVDLTLLTQIKESGRDKIARYYKENFTLLVRRWSIMSNNYQYIVLVVTCLFKVPFIFFLLEFTLWNVVWLILTLRYKEKESVFKKWLAKERLIAK